MQVQHLANNQAIIAHNFLIFDQCNSYSNYFSFRYPKKNPISLLSLSFDIFQYMPKNFIVTTQSGSYIFNDEMIKDTSSVISKYISNNPDSTKYHIDIKDDANVMKKIEDMYCGKKVYFEESEFHVLRRIISTLNIVCCPSFMRPERFKHKNHSHSNFHRYNDYSVIINIEKLQIFLDNIFPKSFTISTKNHEYKCNRLGINSSKIIKEMLEKDPNLSSYFYDFDDEFESFQNICDFFNFQPITITTDNMNTLKNIADDLQIECAICEINDFIESYEKAVQKIDEKNILIDSVVELCDNLYDIKNVGVEMIHDKILRSEWSQTEENVQELVCYLLQVVHNNFNLHSYIMHLLLMLDKNANEENELKILMPYFIKQIKMNFPTNKLNCAFIYRLIQKGFISIDEIIEKILSCLKECKKNKKRSFFIVQNYDDNCKNDKEKFVLKLTNKFEDDLNININNSILKNAIVWFFPELISLKDKNVESQIKDDQFLSSYLPDGIDQYKKMRESGEPDNEISKAIINDDVDTLQKIMSNNPSLPNLIQFNIFDNFSESGNNTFINYAAANGSLKCFKYLLLNHASLDESSFYYAIFGQNVEIIRIVDQFSSQNNIELNCKFVSDDFFDKVYRKSYDDFDDDSEKKKPIRYPIIPAIKKHQNELFNWILENKYINNGMTGNQLYDVASLAVQNGNAYAFIQCIDKGLDLSSLQNSNTCQLIEQSSSCGFYKIVQLIISILSAKLSDRELSFMLRFKNSVYCGNLSIVKLYFSIDCVQFSIDEGLSIASQFGYLHIIKYLFETDAKDKIEFKENGIIKALGNAIQNHQTDVFDYLTNQACLIYILNTNSLYSLLSYCCYIGDLKSAQSITEIIINKNINNDFSEPLMYAAIAGHDKICLYLIDKKVFINYFNIASLASIITLSKKDIFNMIFNSSDDEIKETFLGELLDKSIENQNIEVIEFLLKRDSPYENALFEAVSSHNIEIVNIVLNHNSKPSFINQLSSNGTALNIAVKLNEYDIVKRLLSIPGINPNLYSKKNITPLVSAITNFNLDIINLILNFYGDKIESQTWQIDEAIKEILAIISTQKDKSSYDKIFYQRNYNNLEMKQSNDKKVEKEQILAVLNRLIQIKNIDLNCHAKNYTLLTYACEANETDFVSMLVKSDKVDVNSYSSMNGNTPLMIAIENKNVEIAELLIKLPNININLRNYERKTALIIAVEKNLERIVNLIINNEKFDPEESLLDYAFFISEGKISEILITLNNLNVNYKFIKQVDIKDNDEDNVSYNRMHQMMVNDIKKPDIYLFETTLIHAVTENNQEKIDLIVKHPSFNPIKSQIKVALFNSVVKNNLNIFKYLLSIVGNDVNIRSQSEETLLSCSIRCKSEEIVKEIIYNESFDCLKNNIQEAFLQTYTRKEDKKEDERDEKYIYINRQPKQQFKASIKLMKLLAKFDVEHQHLIDFNKLLPNGKSFYTNIQSYLTNNDEVAAFLLECGVDPDAPDESGDFPLKYFIQNDFVGAALVLIRSGKVDLKRKNTLIEENFMASVFEDASYLHFAACLQTPDILSELLDLNVIDINCTDKLNETPLVKAIKHGSVENVQLLFSKENLNYKQCCDQGMSAIEVAKSVTDYDFGEEETLETKEDYLEYLIHLMNHGSY